MIDPELRRKIEIELGEKCENKELYFRECYLVQTPETRYIVLSPVEKGQECVLTVHPETGEISGLEMWSYAKERGELL